MKAKYLSHRDALSRYNQHQSLIGMPFDRNNADLTITHLFVAPHSAILKWQFLRQVYKGVPADLALNQCNTTRFDVILITQQKHNDEGGFLFKDLADFLDEQELSGSSLPQASGRL